jgi:hypothetical protein
MFESKDAQITAWVNGQTKGKGRVAHVINKVRGHQVEECVPDFSCCTPSLEAPLADRGLFQRAEEGRTRTTLLVRFLAAMLESKGHRVALASGEKI